MNPKSGPSLHDPFPPLDNIGTGRSPRVPKKEKPPLAAQNPYCSLRGQLCSVNGHSRYDGELTLPGLERTVADRCRCIR